MDRCGELHARVDADELRLTRVNAGHQHGPVGERGRRSPCRCGQRPVEAAEQHREEYGDHHATHKVQLIPSHGSSLLTLRARPVRLAAPGFR